MADTLGGEDPVEPPIAPRQLWPFPGAEQHQPRQHRTTLRGVGISSGKGIEGTIHFRRKVALGNASGRGTILGALLYFGMSLTRFQVVEGGLWYFGDLHRWEDIGVYRWTLDSTLWVEFHRRPGLLGPHRTAIEVPPELRGEIDAILVGLNVPRGAEVGGEAPLLGGRGQPPLPLTAASRTGR